MAHNHSLAQAPQQADYLGVLLIRLEEQKQRGQNHE